jgi:hypothetical protein
MYGATNISYSYYRPTDEQTWILFYQEKISALFRLVPRRKFWLWCSILLIFTYILARTPHLCSYTIYESQPSGCVFETTGVAEGNHSRYQIHCWIRPLFATLCENRPVMTTSLTPLVTVLTGRVTLLTTLICAVQYMLCGISYRLNSQLFSPTRLS